MGALKDKIEKDLTEAMRGRQEVRTGALRLLKTAITNKEIEVGAAALDDAGVLGVVRNMVKKGRDSEGQYRAAGREELASQEAAEIAVLQAYLPQAMSQEELAASVAETIAAIGAKGPRDMGAVMKARAWPDCVDRKALSEQVRAQLAKLSG